MRRKIGYLAVFMLVACGQSRDLKGDAFGRGPAQKLAEIRGKSSLGDTVLSLYSGDLDPSRVLGRVGEVSGVLLKTQVVTGSGQAPFEHVTEVPLSGASPLYLVSTRPEKTELAAFIPPETQSLVKKPLLYSRPVEITPVIRHCSEFRFKGNEFMKKPVDCSGIWFCLVPIPSQFACILDSEGQTACEPWQKNPAMTQGVPPGFTRAGFAITEEEPRAFECLHWKNSTSFSYHLRESEKLARFQVRFEPGVRIKVEVPSGQLDSSVSETKWVHFEEESLDFNWDKTVKE